MQGRVQRLSLNGFALPTLSVFLTAITLLLSACVAPNREPPNILGVTQVPGPRAELPREYVFCDMAGGSWTCGEITQKTLVNQPRPTNKLRVPGYVAPSTQRVDAAPTRDNFAESVASVFKTLVPVQLPERSEPDEWQQEVGLTKNRSVSDEELLVPDSEEWQEIPLVQTISSGARSAAFRDSVNSLLNNSSDSSSAMTTVESSSDTVTPEVPADDDSTVVIHFDRKSSRPDFSKLSELVDTLSDSDISIQVHTDDLGGSEYNMMLSQLRAFETFDYLVSTGVPKDRISVRAFGECCSAVPNTNDANRALNRRVEIRAIPHSTKNADS